MYNSNLLLSSFLNASGWTLRPLYLILSVYLGSTASILRLLPFTDSWPGFASFRTVRGSATFLLEGVIHTQK